MTLKINRFEIDSWEYRESLRMRDEIFRKPQGLSIYDDDLSDDYNCEMYGGFIDGEMIAITFLNIKSDSLGIVKSMIVMPDFQKMGFGRMMMNKIHQRAKSMGVKKLILKARVSAEGFYNSLGYKRISDEFDYKGIMHVNMEKELSAEYNIIIANPAGNITAIVRDFVPKDEYIKVAKKIMSVDKYKIEQVGFVSEPKMNSLGRLEMMGGEFCANASRSYALYLAKNLNLKDNNFNIEVSGMNQAIVANVDLKNSLAGININVYRKITEIKIDDISYPVVHLDGIIHVLVFDKEIDDDLNKFIIDKIIDLFNPEAIGIMYIDSINYKLIPLVHVVSLNTYIYESSCGSGTIAASLYMQSKSGDSVWNKDFYQPGGVLSISLKALENNKFDIYISGKVILDEIKLNL